MSWSCWASKNSAVCFKISSRSFSTTRAACRATEVPHQAATTGTPLRMLMFGKPGSGKGTLSARLTSKYDILSISTGDLVRKEIRSKTPLGKEMLDTVNGGGLVSDDVMVNLVVENLRKLKSNQHWILDGFPRTLGQGQLLSSYLHAQPLSLVLNLDVPDSIILSRISDRFIHPASGRVYNVNYNPPQIPGIDDITGEPLHKRADDDDAQIVLKRLKNFSEQTQPLLDFYGNKLVHTLKGETSDEIWVQLESFIQSGWPHLKVRDEWKRKQQSPLEGTTLAEATIAAASS